MKTRCSIWLAILAAVPSVLAQPAYMNYQGRLTDDRGQALPNGLYDVHFRIYDAVIGGTLVWGPFSCDGSNVVGHTVQATLVDGRFNVILGPNDTAGRSLTNAFQGPNRFVELRVGTGSPTPILPRQQFLSAPYALQSTRAQHAQVADLASNLIQALLDDLCPPGTIVAYGGSTAPRGWLWCDGSVVTNIHYPRLYTAISINWGNGQQGREATNIPWQPNTFNLPDLRGMFLRGVNLDRTDPWADPDRTSRAVSRSGGNTGNNVGSVQTNQFKQHVHTEETTYHDAANKHIDVGDDYGNAAQFSGSAGGNETRPNNAYVKYIIKY